MLGLNNASFCNNKKRVSLQWMSAFVIYSTFYVQCSSTAQITVDPPSNIQIKDLGTLGILEITWQPPASMNTTRECFARYELTHQAVNEARWKSVRLREESYRDAFDLGKDVVIKMRTYLKGPCTNEKEVWSEWIKINYPAPIQGTPESKVKDFKCISDKYETLKCEWSTGNVGNSSNYELNFWQAGMFQTKTCTNYITLNEINTGCDFRSEKFEFFSDLFICVTGMPGTDPIQPSYFIFQLQNVGKPGIPENITMTKVTYDEIVVEWIEPMGKLPAHCFLYEIQSKNQTNKWQTVAMQEASKYSFKISETSQLYVRVRGKASIYCANDGYWSDWSPEVVWTGPEPPEERVSKPEPPFKVWSYSVVVGIILLTGLCIAASMYTVKKRKQWSKKLQYKAKELVYEIDPGHDPKC